MYEQLKFRIWITKLYGSRHVATRMRDSSGSGLYQRVT